MLEHYAMVKAIEGLTAQPSKSFSVRGLAAASGISPGAAGEALSYMKKKGIATLQVIGRTHQYRANLESPLCRQWKILFNLDLLQDSGIARGLAEKIPNVQSVLLYGSFARGTNDGKSDIDLLAIAHKPARVDLGFVNGLGREANVTVMSMGEWKKKAVEGKVFYENVIYDSIVLYGERPVIA
jgi:predicted nucleotidyltransferase